MGLKRRKFHFKKINYLPSTIFGICFILLFIFEYSNQEKVPGEEGVGNHNEKQKHLRLGSENDNVKTEFADADSNKHKSANYNFCPSPCSCLGNYFECKKTNLTHVPKLPRWVRNLELTGNKLDDEVENTIGNLSELTTLNLKKNHLHAVPVFKGLISLEKLNLAHNKIQTINVEALLSLPNLRDLDLSRNIIKTLIPHSFPTKNNLISINLNFNRLTFLEDSVFDPLTKLTQLYMSHNNLTNLPSGIFKLLSVLKKLDLSSNRLNITWSTFKGLSELKVLKLNSNEIKSLPDGVFHPLKSLATIELDSNRITHLNRQEFYNLTSLTTLSLSNNSIDRIETDTWEFTQQLVALDLSYNSLTEIRAHHLDCLNHLRILNFGHNKIQHISNNAFECTKNLEHLDLSYNLLSWTIEDTTGIFRSLNNLQRLDLSRNDVKSINQKAFSGLENLKVLNLEFNNLTSMQFNTFESLKKLEKLVLNSNHFVCDCNIQWFYTWLKNNQAMSKLVSIFCDYPLQLRKKSLQSLKEEDFMCNESPKPRLIKEPTNQLAIKGTNAVLECSAVSSLLSDMHIQWKRDNFDIHVNEIESKLLKTNNNSTMLSSYLHLQNVNHNHTGKYQCIVTNSFGTTYSQKFKITVATYPGFSKVPSNITLNSGNTARLDCSAYGEPTPQIAWQKDGGNDFPAARERRMHVMPTDDAFFIINAKISDMGVYTCTAENPAGIIKANATLIVYEQPGFVKPMESKEVTQGTSSVLECMASGSPKPALNWFKDDKPLKLTERHFFAAESQLLIIVDTKLADSGVYVCEMKNDLGSVSGNLTLKVNKAMSKNVINVEEMTGIVVITVFCCAVGTSVIWVVIIYQTKKGNDFNANNFSNSNLNSGQLLNQVTNASNINDEHRLMIESNPQSSQVIFMNHLNGNDKHELLYHSHKTTIVAATAATAATITVPSIDDIDAEKQISFSSQDGDIAVGSNRQYTSCTDDRQVKDHCNYINYNQCKNSHNSQNCKHHHQNGNSLEKSPSNSLPSETKATRLNDFPPLSISNNDNIQKYSNCKHNSNHISAHDNLLLNGSFQNGNDNGSSNGDHEISSLSSSTNPLLINKKCTDNSLNNLNDVNNSIPIIQDNYDSTSMFKDANNFETKNCTSSSRSSSSNSSNSNSNSSTCSNSSNNSSTNSNLNNPNRTYR